MTLSALSTPTVTFDSFSLQSTDYKTESILDSLHSLPPRTINAFPVSRTNKSIVTSTEYKSRRIQLVGFIDDTTSEASLQGKVDTLKQIARIRKTDKNLDIEYAGGTRRFRATVESLDIRKDVSSKYNYTINFFCSVPFGYSTTQTTVTESGVTAATKSITTSITGSTVPFDSTITIDVNTETDLTEIEIENTENGDTLTLTRAYTAGDTIEISYETKQVLVNGTEFDYTGIIPEFNPGSNDWEVRSTSTAHNIDIELVYSPTYL